MTLLFPSPNWFHDQLVDLNEGTLCAYGSKNSVVIIDFESKIFVTSLMEHTSRISGVQFLTNSTLVSCSEDKRVIIWDINTKSILMKHQNHKFEITSICYSNDTIVTGDKHGNIIIWKNISKYTTQTLSNFQFLNNTIMTLKVSTFDSNIIAIGYKNGVIIILNLLNFDILFKLYGHEDEIQSLSWKYSMKNKILASSSKDKTIRIWKLNENDFECCSILKLSNNEKRMNKNENTTCWISLKFNQHFKNILISSSCLNDQSGNDINLIEWTINDENGKIEKKKIFLNAHKRLIFSLNFHLKQKYLLITSSMDREIRIWNLKDLKSKYIIRCLGGIGISLDQNLISSKICIGCSDKMIRIIDPNNSNFYKQIWKGIQSKVTCLKYHPSIENLIIFGCQDGRIGFIKSNEQTKIFHSYHKSSILNLEWILNEKEEIKFLSFSLNENILINDINKFERKSKILKLKYDSIISSISTNYNNNWILIGFKNGNLNIYQLKENEELNLIKSIKDEQTHEIIKLKINLKNNFIASLSKDNLIFIFNNNFNLISKLKGHENDILDLSWSNHNDNLIASCSIDKSIQIWNIQTGEGLYNFRNHFGKVFSIQWSILKEDIIYSSGDDDLLLKWNYKIDSKFKVPPQYQYQKQKQKKNQVGKIGSSNGGIGGGSDSNGSDNQNKNSENNLSKIIQKTEKSLFKLSNTSNLNLKVKQDSCIELLSYLKKRKYENDETEIQSQNQSQSQSQTQNENKKFKVMNNEQQDDIFYNYPDLNLFSKNNLITQEINEMVKEEEEEKKKNEKLLFLYFYNGEIEKCLNLLHKEIKPNLLWLSISSQLGKEVYSKMCKFYSEKYEEIGEIKTSVSINLSYNNLNEAIEVLKRSNLYRDAISLYKSRININNIPLNKNENEYLFNLYQDWAKYSLEILDYENASKCYFFCNQFKKGIKCIELRNQYQFKNYLICSILSKEINDLNQMNYYLNFYFLNYWNLFLSNQNFIDFKKEILNFKNYNSLYHLFLFLNLEYYFNDGIEQSNDEVVDEMNSVDGNDKVEENDLNYISTIESQFKLDKQNIFLIKIEFKIELQESLKEFSLKNNNERLKFFEQLLFLYFSSDNKELKIKNILLLFKNQLFNLPKSINNILNLNQILNKSINEFDVISKYCDYILFEKKSKILNENLQQVEVLKLSLIESYPIYFNNDNLK
eukprot:gene1924-1064_t